MNQELMTLDFWQDTVIYEGKIFPIGTLACDALNVPADTLARMNEQCEKINLLLGMLNAGQDASALFPMAKEAVLTMVDILSETPPFSNMNIPKHRERIEKVFTADNALKYMEFAIKAATNSLQFEEIPNYADAMMLQRYTAVFGHLAYSLGEYQTAMLDFAEKSDGNEADRTAEGFARMFGSYFPPEFSITEGNAWMSTLNNSVQYVSVIRPGEKVAKLVKRIHYVSFVGMFRSDLFEGLCVGHAPKKCKICGMVSDNQRKAHQILRRLCAGGQATPHLPTDRQSERQRTTGACRRSSCYPDIRKAAEYHKPLYQAWQTG